MSNIVIEAEAVAKQYRLGQVGRRTLSHDVNRWWHKVRGKADPYLKIGQENNRTVKGESEYVWALQDINFNVQEGEVLGIIGRNGAGKSTLLKILSKVTAPTKGQVKIRGRIASLLEVGTGFHQDLSGRENIFLNGAILGMTKKEIAARFDEIVDFAGVARYIDTPVKRYSSGMYVRLAFAVAAHLEPEILIIDEVLAVGDAEFQKKCLGKMKDVSEKDGRTVLFVSHQMAAVMQLCSRALVIDKGKLTYNGNAADAIQHYLENSGKEAFEQSNIIRKGNGKVQVVAIEIIRQNSVAHSSTEISSGDDVVFKFKVQNTATIDILSSYLEFRIDDARGNRICWFSTKLLRYATLDLSKDICFSIKKLPLNSGTFYLTYYLSVNNEISDWVQNAMKFHVYESDFFDTGLTVPQQQTSILIPFEIL